MGSVLPKFSHDDKSSNLSYLEVCFAGYKILGSHVLSIGVINPLVCFPLP